jgi:hypothetical protein
MSGKGPSSAFGAFSPRAGRRTEQEWHIARESPQAHRFGAHGGFGGSATAGIVHSGPSAETHDEEYTMKKICLTLPLLLLALEASAADLRKPCDELAREIAVKIEANGVKAYALETIDAAAVSEGQRIVGSCEGGTRRIVYSRVDRNTLVVGVAARD